MAVCDFPMRGGDVDQSLGYTRVALCITAPRSEDTC